MTDIVQIGATEKDAINFFTALLDEHIEKSWDYGAVDFRSRLTTSDGYTDTFFHIWSDNYKVWDIDDMPYDPTQPPGERFPFWATKNMANKNWVKKSFLELKSEGLASRAKSSITVHNTKQFVKSSVFVHYRILNNVLMSPVPHELEKAVVKWAAKNKRYISAQISPLGYWEKHGSKEQTSKKMDDSVRSHPSPKSTKRKSATIIPINKKRV